MTLAQAFQEATEKSKKVRKKIGIEIPTPSPIAEDCDPEQVPRMYRAQTEGRCSLQFAGDRDGDLKHWVKEWIAPISDQNPQPRYQRQEPSLGWDGSVYRLKISFPWRVCTNCGTDSILRPVLGKDGIPFFPGSSVKGLFRRLLNAEQLDAETKQAIQHYCGSQAGRGQLRFHGAYPIGDWAGTQQITNQRTEPQETRYRMVDVLHPQQPRQVEGTGSASAFTLVTLFQPTLIFELSSAHHYDEEHWKEIAGLLRRALSQGLGGKTSTGYGLWVIPKRYALRFDLQGVGVSSLLRSDEPEFRPNMFKASLRGHAKRLLAGVCNDPKRVKEQVDKLFGHTQSPGYAQLYWEWQPKDFEMAVQGIENTAVYRIKGSLHVDIDRKLLPDNSDYEKNLAFMRSLSQFAYVMGGFGKSWRRIWHKSPEAWANNLKGFLPSYKTRAIGCHWQYSDKFELETITARQKLTTFLQTLYQNTQRFISIQQPQCIQSWRESWSPSRVVVYCSQPVFESSVIQLFHQDDRHPFKMTPAICGKKKVKKQRNGREVEDLEFHVSSVWHRMLPIGNNQYLEIVTVFHGDRKAWSDQLFPFINALKERELQLIWGDEL